MKSRKFGLLKAAGLFAAIGAALAVASIGHADPSNPSFETGDFSGWTTFGSGSTGVDAGGAPGGGAFFGRASAGGEDDPVGFEQTFSAVAGEELNISAQFNSAELANECFFNDIAVVEIVDPSATVTELFFANSCGSANGPNGWTPINYVYPSTGNYTLRAYVANVGDSSVASQVNLDADAIPPHWVVRAKIGGGNVINESLPEYVPGTWATKNVTVYLQCVAGDNPIDIQRKDQAVTFKDGEWYYSTKPTDECIDEAGLSAEPIVDWGPIMVDTKAPNCKVTPSTIYVPRNTSANPVFALDSTDATSGAAAVVFSSGPVTGGAVLNSGSASTTFIDLNVTMGSSTAGRIEVPVTVVDNAGNTSTCKAIVRAK